MKSIYFLLTISFSSICLAGITPSKLQSREIVNVNEVSPKVFTKLLTSKFKKNLKNDEIQELKKQIIGYAGKSIPALVEVMKSKNFPDKSRWLATFLVGRIMGSKAAPFLAKFMKHPNWVLRMASMKTLMALKQKQYKIEYGQALKDQSFIVRRQALETIKHLELNDLAPQVWAMLYDKKNYYSNKKTNKRTNLIKEAVKTVGDLNFAKAREPLFKMAQKKKYQDIFNEIDYSLQKITGKKSPNKDLGTKRRYWSKVALSFKSF